MTPRPDLRPGRLLRVWAPLAATFLLVTGSTPIVNAAINRLPGRDQEAELAAFALFFVCTIVLHSPLFVAREIAIKLSVDRAGSRRALRFCLGAAATVSAVEIVLGTTSLGRTFLQAFSTRADVVDAAYPGFLWVAPAPLFIAARGVYQAHQIRVDDTLFVGLGTVVRLGFTAVLGLVVAPHVGLGGPQLGGLCVSAGVAVEAAFAAARARAAARPPEHSDEPPIRVAAFGLQLMFANVLGVATSLFYVRIAGLVPALWEKASLAAFQEVRTIHLLIGSSTVALQSLTTAKVRRPGDFLPMLRFTVAVGAVLCAVFAVIALTPLRDRILVDLMHERAGGDVVVFARPALLLAIGLPLLGGVRFCLRGLLIARGSTRAITFANIATLALLAGAVGLRLFPSAVNGTANAYAAWNVALCLEIALLASVASRVRRRDAAALAVVPPPLRP